MRVSQNRVPLTGVIKCPNWTSSKYWGYNFQQIFEGDVQYSQNGTFTNPCLHQCLASFLHIFPMNIDFSWQLASISGPCLKIPSVKTTKNLSRCWFSSNQRHPADFGRSRSAHDLPDKSCMFSASEPTLCIRDCWFSVQRKMLVELGDNFDRHLIFGYVGGT